MSVRSDGEVIAVLTIFANAAAFYLGVMSFERAGFFCGVAVFLITALTGTVFASMIEENLGLFYSRVCNERGNGRAGRSLFPVSLL